MSEPSDHNSRDLGQVQRWLQSVIMHPGGVAAGVASDAAQAEIQLAGPDDLPRVIGASRALSSAERLEVYAHAYYARLLECLREEYPVLCHTMGRELFDEFAFGYLQAYPSRSYTLAHLGAEFPRFLEESIADCPADDEGWPAFFSELARLEWTFNEVFDGPGIEELPGLTENQLRGIEPAAWSAARLRPAPCLRLLSFHYPVNEFYTLARSGPAPPLPAPRQTLLAVSRRDYVVRRHELSPAGWRLLDALVAGQTVGEALAMVEAQHAEGDVNALASQIENWFFGWARNGFFLAID